MAMCKSYIRGNTVVHLEGRGVVSPVVEPQVIVEIRSTSFNNSASNLCIRPATIHRFHLGEIPLPRALPVIVSFVGDRMHGVHATDCRLWNVLLGRFFSEAAATMMAESVLELLVHVGVFLGPRESDEEVELFGDWMIDNPHPPEQGAVYDNVLYDFDVDGGHGGFGGVPASGSFIDGLRHSPYGRGDGIREEKCVICLEEFNAHAEVTKMPCSHAFHTRCIIQWLEMSNLCPICKFQMPTASTT